MGSEPVRGQVKRRYAAGALSVREGGASFCCWLDAGRVLASEEPRVRLGWEKLLGGREARAAAGGRRDIVGLR